MFGRYELGDLLGAGAMGTVYRARDTKLKREVALKRLTPDLQAHPDFIARFRQECELLATLHHQHIVTIYDFDEVDGRLYISMELLDGQDLAEQLKGGPVGVQYAVEIVEQVASALAAAHSAGILHRDVKPSNIMLAANGGARIGSPFASLVDFGIARLMSDSALAITRTAEAIGSVPYMAPERFDKSTPVDERADVYSLACVLYEALTSEPPFPGTSYAEIIRGHQNVPPPSAHARNPTVPLALDHVIRRGLAKKPADRFASAVELARAAAAAVAPPEGSPRSDAHVPSPRGFADSRPHRDLTARRWRVPLAACALVLIAVFAVVATILLRRADNTQASGHPPETGPSSATPAAAGHPVQPGVSMSSSTTAIRPPRSSPIVLASGTCLSARSQEISCVSEHTYEVVTLGSNCSFDVLLSYVGGSPGTDTLLPSVHAFRLTHDGDQYCTVVGPAGAHERGSARSVLTSTAAAAWRRCFDNRQASTVGCNRPHTTEYVFAQPGAITSTVSCTVRAGQYLGIAFANVADQLSLETLPKGSPQACTVTARGDELLTGSLRGIGTNTLPLQPG